MTNEQAISDLVDYKIDHDLEIRDDAINMAIHALKVEHCTDYIRRKDIIGKCLDLAESTSYNGIINEGFIMALDFIADYAKNLPLVDPERVSGKWVDESYAGATCSVCGYQCHEQFREHRSYCPNCGSYNGGRDETDN